MFAALPFRDTAVALRLFRNATDGSVLAALGTLGGAVCTLELWKVDASGRIVPVDTPQEPDVSAFFAPGRKMPPDVQATVMICLGLGGLKAQPLFWTSTGMDKNSSPLRPKRGHAAQNEGRCRASSSKNRTTSST